MTLAVDFRVDVRPYSGYADPSLPIATWIAQGNTIGDASGGNLLLTFLFQQGDDSQISELFNLEQIAFDSSVSGGHNGSMRTLAMDSLAPNRPMFGMIWPLVLVTTQGGSDSALSMDTLKLPIWLGSPNREEGDGGLRLTVANTDLELYAATLQGYMWGPRSILAPGGPQRPLGALWG